MFVKSRYGKPAIQLGPYRFNRWSGSKGDKARWVCTRDHGGCRAKIYTYEDAIISMFNVHNH